MPTVPATSLKRETAGLVRLADRDLAALWRMVSQGAAAETALRDLLPAIVEEYGSAGAAAAADWYDDQREKAGVGRRFFATPVDVSDRGAHSLIGYALNTATDDKALHELILGGVQRRIADHLRLTITSNSIADPAAEGWMRVGSGECEWCQQYLDGEIHYADGYDFDAHDWCKCDAVPAF